MVEEEGEGLVGVGKSETVRRVLRGRGKGMIKGETNERLQRGKKRLRLINEYQKREKKWRCMKRGNMKGVLGFVVIFHGGNWEKEKSRTAESRRYSDDGKEELITRRELK